MALIPVWDSISFMDNFLMWAFLGLTIQPCVSYFLVSFSTQQSVFCVSKFRVVGKGLPIAPKDQGHLPGITKLQELQSGHAAGLDSTALLCSEQSPGGACAGRTGGAEPEPPRKSQRSPCSHYHSWPSPAEEPYAAETADSSGISQGPAALRLPPSQ